MTRILKATLPFLMLTGSMLVAQEIPTARAQSEKGQAEQTFQQATVGKIIESLDSKQELVKYVLLDSANTVYQLEDQAAAKNFAGKIVKVSGPVDEANNSIHVTGITPAA